jgi:hypothetical protein
MLICSLHKATAGNIHSIRCQSDRGGSAPFHSPYQTLGQWLKRIWRGRLKVSSLPESLRILMIWHTMAALHGKSPRLARDVLQLPSGRIPRSRPGARRGYHRRSPSPKNFGSGMGNQDHGGAEVASYEFACTSFAPVRYGGKMGNRSFQFGLASLSYHQPPHTTA